MTKLKRFTKEFMSQFQKDNVPLLAAAQAYHYLLSIFPMLIVCFALIPYFNFNPKDAILFMENILPREIASVLEENILGLIQTPRGGLLTIGIIGALWSASNGINAFIKSINEAFDIEETRSFIVVRLIALGLTFGMIIALAAAMLLAVFGSVIIGYLESILGISTAITILFHLLRWVISITVITALLMALYRFAPNKKLPWKHVIPGALVASVLWQLISLGFSFYVSNFGSYSATYGSLGGIIVLMIWFFLTGLILMIGAEVNVLYHRKNRQYKEQARASNL